MMAGLVLAGARNPYQRSDWKVSRPGYSETAGRFGSAGLRFAVDTAIARSLFCSLPVAFVYSFFVEYYVSGMTGSVKE